MLRDRLLVLASVRCKMSDDNVNVAVQYIKKRLLEFSGRLVESGMGIEKRLLFSLCHP